MVATILVAQTAKTLGFVEFPDFNAEQIKQVMVTL